MKCNILENLRPDIWKTLSENERKETYQNILSFIKDEISRETIDGVRVNLSKFSKMPLFIQWKDNETMNGENGSYGNHIIKLNNKFLKCDAPDYKNDLMQGIDGYYALLHETQHAFQHFLIMQSQKLFADASLKQYVRPLRINNCSNTQVNIPKLGSDKIEKVQGTLNIKTIVYAYASDAKEISNTLYMLSAAERDAWSVSAQKTNFLIHTLKKKFGYDSLDYKNDEVWKRTSDFKELYNCSHLSNHEVHALIDKCFENIYFQDKPENDLEASVMYDISCIAAINKKSIKLSKCADYLDEIQKSKILKDNPYITKEDAQIISKLNYKGYMLCPEQFDNLSTEVQIKNTALAIYIASEKLNELKTYIKNLDAIRTYCMENVSKVISADYAEDGITNLFGQEFYEVLKYVNDKHHGISMDENVYNAMKNLIMAERDEMEEQSKQNTDNMPNVNIQPNNDLDIEHCNSSYSEQNHEDDMEY